VSVENQAGSLELSGPAALETVFSDRAAARWVLIAFGYYFALIGLIAASLDRLLPARIPVTFFGHDFSVDDVHRHVIAGGTFALVVVPAVFAIELLLVGWSKSSLRHLIFSGSASSRSDLVVFLLWQGHVLNIFRMVLTFGVALISGIGLHDFLNLHAGIDLTLNGLPPALSYPLYLLLFTFFDYWTHRLDHTSRFWPIHRYHHAARDFCILTSDRGHPANVTYIVATVMPFGLFDAPPQVAFWIYLAIGAHHLLIHSRIESDLGWIGRYIVQSPTHHRLHHAIDTSKPIAHFSLLPLWDHLFGTWQGGTTRPIEIGVADSYRQGIWVFPDLWRDYCEFVSGFFRRNPS
jgi:sterol desaturase/sphingolipid hydroxylase (fatty acid hydroxylase superfamily)